jgi:L1 cell adhesion molecule like protein
MVNDAEKYKAEDEAVAARVASKNGLESYSYNLRNSIEGDLKDKLEADDKAKLEKEINETISWLDASQEASKEEYDERQKALEAVANPIMVSLRVASLSHHDNAPD